MPEGTRRRFDKEFKMETARLMVEKGRKASELARDLDIHVHAIMSIFAAIFTLILVPIPFSFSLPLSFWVK